MSNCQDINVLESVNKAIGPLQEFTDMLSGENYVSVSYLKPVKKLFNRSLLQPEEGHARKENQECPHYSISTISTKTLPQLEHLDMSSLVDPRVQDHMYSR